MAFPRRAWERDQPLRCLQLMTYSTVLALGVEPLGDEFWMEAVFAAVAGPLVAIFEGPAQSSKADADDPGGRSSHRRHGKPRNGTRTDAATYAIYAIYEGDRQ